MKIGVNSRIVQQSKTGVPYYVHMLYKQMQGDFQDESYSFLQTSSEVSIGPTYTSRLTLAKRYVPFFDLFYVMILAKRRGAEILHGPAHILPFFKPRNMVYVVTIHDLAQLHYPEFYSKLFRLYYAFALKRSLKTADHIFAVSQNTADDIKKYMPIVAKKISVNYCGINEFYLNDSIDERLINKPYIFSITTHPKRKNIYSVLESIARDNWVRDNFKYVIAGHLSNENLVDLNSKIEELKLQEVVVLQGYVTEANLKNLYKYASLFIYPSYYEGFGLPVVEAMACRCPVITSNASSTRELLPSDDWLVDPHNIDDIQGKIKKILTLSKQDHMRLIEENFAFIDKFSWERTAREIHSTYEELLEQKSFV